MKLREALGATKTLQQRFDELFSQKQNLDAILGTSKEKAMQLAAQLAFAQQELKQQIAARGKAEQSAKETQTKLDQAQTQITRLKESLAETEQKLKAAETKITELRDSLAKTQQPPAPKSQ